MSDFPADWTDEQVARYWRGIERALTEAPVIPEPDDEGVDYPEPLL